jgi:hypothetical protein
MVMTAQALVSALFVGLDNGEFATIPVLLDQRECDAHDAHTKLSSQNPAERFELKG